MNDERVPMTDRQREVYDFITDESKARGYAVSIREITKRFNFRSPTAAVCHLKALRRKGYVTWEPRTARSIRAVGGQNATIK